MTDTSTTFTGHQAGSGPVTCATCGCRLQLVGTGDAGAYFHFGALGGRDARGCRVACADMAHDRSGEPASSRLA